jgi:hypothetical protein
MKVNRDFESRHPAADKPAKNLKAIANAFQVSFGGEFPIDHYR